MATIKEKIAGLYIAFFDRAGDQEGLDYWVAEANRLGEKEALSQLAAGFASHPKFSALYDHLSNQEFVAAIYINVLGKAGDSEGIAYWTEQLNSGMSRSDMVADFISISLDFNPNDPQYSTLSQEEITTALARQALLQNKVNLSLEFIETLQEKTNLLPTTNPYDPASLDNDPAYKASVKILEDINESSDTLENAQEALALIADKEDAINLINSVPTFSPEAITEAIEQNSMNNLHNVNSGLGESIGVAQEILALDSGIHWESKVVTYSFNKTIPESYQADPTLTNNWHELTEQMQTSVIDIMDTLNTLLDIDLQMVSDGGDIRFNLVDTNQESAGFAFYPSKEYDIGGDIFLSNEFVTDPELLPLTPGKEGYATILHELGHALGLKHPFEEPNTLPSSLDDTNHTLMSYKTAYSINPQFTLDGDTIYLEYTYLYPENYGLYDLETLQSIYGRNTATNLEDNSYSLQFSDQKIVTIWDAGGEDTIDLSNTKGRTTIDLRGGTLNSVDEYSFEEIVNYYQERINRAEFNDWIEMQLGDLYNSDQLYTGANNFAIPKGVIIENIITGSGNDTIIDNSVDNSIVTNGGDDNIYIGNGGFDYIDGGEGVDTLYLDLEREQFTLSEVRDSNYLLIANSFGAQLVGIENLHLQDDVSYPLEDIAG